MTLQHPQEARGPLPVWGAGLRAAARELSRVVRTDALRVPATAFVTHLGIVWAVAALAVALLPTRTIEGVLPPPRVGGIGRYLIQPLSNWDGAWYSLIAEQGYGAQREAAAFWPLYPLLLRAGHFMTGWSVPVIGVIVSNLALLAALIVFYRLVDLDHGPAVARRATWLLALFPTSFYFSAVYTESLFLLTTVAAVYFGRTERWGRAAAAGALAALTRNTGVLLLIPLGLLLIEQRGWSPRRWWAPGLKLTAIAAAPLLYLWHLDRLWGNPLLTMEVQRHWGRHTAMPWETLADAFGRLGTFYASWLIGCLSDPSYAHLMQCVEEVRTRPSPFAGPLAVAGTLVVLPLTAYILLRMRRAYGLYGAALVVVPLFAPAAGNPVMSMPRFLVVIFPIFIGLALLLRNRWLYRTVLALSTVSGAAILTLFSILYFVG